MAKLRTPAFAKTSLLGVTFALAVLGFMVLGGAQARASHVDCGDTITTDTTLDSDLLNCPNNGIRIGADDITLDLNGHTVDGDGMPAAGCDPETEFCDEGIPNLGHDGVTVMHGSVRGFVNGVAVAFARDNRLLGLSSSRNRSTGFFVNAHDNRLLGLSASRNRFAGLFLKCVRCLVRNSAGNRTKGSGPDQVGIFLFQSHHDRIIHSTFRHNVPSGSGSGGGILSVESTSTVIRGNLIARNGEAGIIMEKSDGFRISHNRLGRNNDGIALGPGSHNVITRNHVFRSGDGIRIEKGHGNLVAHNVVAHTRGAGIRLGFEVPEGISGSAHTLVRRNLVRGSRGEGFLVGKKDRHSRLKGNVAKRSGDDGFDVESRSTTLTRNGAFRNGDLGIEAVRGVDDGGGNVARHNGNPLQCTNVVCN